MSTINSIDLAPNLDGFKPNWGNADAICTSEERPAWPLIYQIEDSFPKGSKFLYVTNGGDRPTLSYLVDRRYEQGVEVLAELEIRRFQVCTDGSHMPVSAARLQYLGMFQREPGLLRFHVFEQLGEAP